MGAKIDIRKLLLRAKAEVEIERGKDELSHSLYEQKILYETVDYYKNMYPEFKKEMELIEKLEVLADKLGYNLQHGISLGQECLDFNGCIDELVRCNNK